MNEETVTLTRSEFLKKMQEVQTMEFMARVDDLRALKEKYGDEIIDVIQNNRAGKTRQRWQAVAARIGRNDIGGLKQTLWRIVKEAGCEFTFEDTADGTSFNVTKCPLADMAKKLGAEDWGFLFYCAEDINIAEGFNENIGFTRTKSLMEGHDCCNHHYYMKTKD